MALSQSLKCVLLFISMRQPYFSSLEPIEECPFYHHMNHMTKRRHGRDAISVLVIKLASLQRISVSIWGISIALRKAAPMFAVLAWMASVRPCLWKASVTGTMMIMCSSSMCKVKVVGPVFVCFLGRISTQPLQILHTKGRYFFMGYYLN